MRALLAPLLDPGIQDLYPLVDLQQIATRRGLKRSVALSFSTEISARPRLSSVFLLEWPNTGIRRRTCMEDIKDFADLEVDSVVDLMVPVVDETLDAELASVQYVCVWSHGG